MAQYMCEECDIEMHPFAEVGGESGYACSGCGWSFDNESDSGSPFALAPAEPVPLPTSLVVPND